MILRVFPRRTALTPTDPLAVVGDPRMLLPDGISEVRVSCAFTWDRPKAERLARAWGQYYPTTIGGPAYDDPGNGFVAGQYVRRGVTFTSRGCPNQCPFCFVPKREGKLRELPVVPGNVIQDNNILACSSHHLDRVFDMLKTQHGIEFKGGLQASRITDQVAERFASLSIKSLWLACDYPEAVKPLERAVRRLQRHGFNRNKVYCYVLIGNDREENEVRLRSVFDIGALPFAQLYQPPEGREYSLEWRQFQRRWSRPAIIKSTMRRSQ